LRIFYPIQAAAQALTDDEPHVPSRRPIFIGPDVVGGALRPGNTVEIVRNARHRACGPGFQVKIIASSICELVRGRKTKLASCPTGRLFTESAIREIVDCRRPVQKNVVRVSDVGVVRVNATAIHVYGRIVVVKRGTVAIDSKV
jgi:hypothetical protein